VAFHWIRIFAPARGLELDHAFFELCVGRRNQFHECRLGGLPPEGRNPAEAFLQPRKSNRSG